MSFQINRSASIPVIEIEGKFLGSLEGDALKEAINQSKEQGDIRFVVDLSKTDFVDSSGIGILIGCLTSLRKEGGDIRLAGMHKRIKAVFLMTKLLGNVFELFENREHAILSYEKDAKVAAKKMAKNQFMHNLAISIMSRILDCRRPIAKQAPVPSPSRSSRSK